MADWKVDIGQGSLEYGESLLAQAKKRSKKRKKKRRIFETIAGALTVGDFILKRKADHRIASITQGHEIEKATAIANLGNADRFNTNYVQEMIKAGLNPDDLRENGDAHQYFMNLESQRQRAYDPKGSSLNTSDEDVSKENKENYNDILKANSKSAFNEYVKKYTKYSGYINDGEIITDEAMVNARFDAILKDATRQVYSPQNVSSIRKILGKFGIADTVDPTLREIEMGGETFTVSNRAADLFSERAQTRANNFTAVEEAIAASTEKYGTDEDRLYIAEQNTQLVVNSLDEYYAGDGKTLAPYLDSIAKHDTSSEAGIRSSLFITTEENNTGTTTGRTLHISGNKYVPIFQDVQNGNLRLNGEHVAGQISRYNKGKEEDDKVFIFAGEGATTALSEEEMATFFNDLTPKEQRNLYERYRYHLANLHRENRLAIEEQAEKAGDKDLFLREYYAGEFSAEAMAQTVRESVVFNYDDPDTQENEMTRMRGLIEESIFQAGGGEGKEAALADETPPKAGYGKINDDGVFGFYDPNERKAYKFKGLTILPVREIITGDNVTTEEDAKVAGETMANTYQDDIEKKKQDKEQGISTIDKNMVASILRESKNMEGKWKDNFLSELLQETGMDFYSIQDFMKHVETDRELSEMMQSHDWTDAAGGADAGGQSGAADWTPPGGTRYPWDPEIYGEFRGFNR
tara:strand:- start:25483 stop:27558 length:2076 start_codon:yes stop_codon:yes gene_type:complete